MNEYPKNHNLTSLPLYKFNPADYPVVSSMAKSANYDQSACIGGSSLTRVYTVHSARLKVYLKDKIMLLRRYVSDIDKPCTFMQLCYS